MTDPAIKDAEVMREAAAVLAESEQLTGEPPPWVSENGIIAAEAVVRATAKSIASAIRALPLPEPTPDPRDATIGRLSAQVEIARAALAKTEDFISSHVSDMEDGQRPHEREYLALAIKYRDRARAVLSRLDAKEPTPASLSSQVEAAREALARIDVIIETGKVNHAKVAQKVARAVLAKLAEGARSRPAETVLAKEIAKVRECEPTECQMDSCISDHENMACVCLLCARAVLAKLAEGA